MSKTWRGDERKGRRGALRGQSAAIDYTRRSEQPEVVTEEWAVERMAEHVNYVLESLIDTGEVYVVDKEDYRSMINREIIRAVPYYDPDRKDEEGRTSSAVHFLTVVVDNAVQRVRRFNRRMRRGHVTVPPGERPPLPSWISEKSELLGDGGRSVRELELRMDVNTLFGLLTDVEQRVLAMRLEGHSYNDIGDALGCTRQYVLKAFVPRIQLVARDCGFYPASERRD